MKINVERLAEQLLGEGRELPRPVRDEVDDLFTHTASKCAYGHQDVAKRLVHNLTDINDPRLKAAVRACGNEFDLRQKIEEYLDSSCKFHEEAAAGGRATLTEDATAALLSTCQSIKEIGHLIINAADDLNRLTTGGSGQGPVEVRTTRKLASAKRFLTDLKTILIPGQV